MAKKEIKKSSPEKTGKVNLMLLENFTELQKSFTNLAVKLDNLSEQISKLLQLFEFSAKSFAEKLPATVVEIEKDKEFLEKIDKLIEQNKLVAKSLSLMGDQLKERIYPARIQRPGFMLPQQTREGYSVGIFSEAKPKKPLS